jgi:hypothetical protein
MTNRVQRLLPALAAWLCAACIVPWPAVAGEATCWTRFFGAPGSSITDLAADSQGIWAAGRMTGDGTTPVLWVALLGENGRLRWQLPLPAQGYQLYPRLAPGREVMRVVAEIPLPSMPAEGGGSLGASGLWIGSVDRAGRLVGQQTLAPHRVTTVQAVAPLDDGGLLLAGLAESGPDPVSKGWLARLDRDGRLAGQHLLPRVSWLTSLSRVDTETWLVAGTAQAQEGGPRPWLALVDQEGRIRQSWSPAVDDFSLTDAVATVDAFWLAGEGPSGVGGIRLLRVGRAGAQVVEYPVSGGDGPGDRSPAEPESAPGGLVLSGEAMADPARVAGSPAGASPVFRFQDLPAGELHALRVFPGKERHPGPVLLGAGTHPDRGAWIGCTTANVPFAPGGVPKARVSDSHQLFLHEPESREGER